MNTAHHRQPRSEVRRKMMCTTVFSINAHSNMGHGCCSDARPVHGSGPLAAALSLCDGGCWLHPDGVVRVVDRISLYV